MQVELLSHLRFGDRTTLFVEGHLAVSRENLRDLARMRETLHHAISINTSHIIIGGIMVFGLR